MSEVTADAVRPGDQDGDGTADTTPTTDTPSEVTAPSDDNANEVPTEDQGSGSQLDQ